MNDTERRMRLEWLVTQRESILVLCKAFELEGLANINEGGFAETQTNQLRQCSAQLDDLAREIGSIGS